MTLAFVGDVMLGRRVNEAAASRHPESFWGDALPVLRSADAVIANLECPITTRTNGWRRTWKAFRFRADPTAVNVLKAANVRFVNLANNHMLDFEEDGLLDTLDHLDAAAIAHAGAGRNSIEAATPAVLDVAGLKVGLLALTDNMPEFAAGRNRPGTNFVKIRTNHTTLGLIELLVDRLRRAGAGFIVLTVHWGPNLRASPPRRFRSFARAVLDIGVDLIHGHSAHLFQGVELHENGLILYDTGDFLNDYWVFPFIRVDRSFVFLTELKDGRLRRARMVPVSLEPTRVGLANGTEFDAIRRRMHARCRSFATPVSYTREGLEIVVPRGGPVGDRPGERGDKGCITAPRPRLFYLPG
ncbi:MAG: CapA family protein [Alphaproteobacteria bacterium]